MNGFDITIASIFSTLTRLLLHAHASLDALLRKAPRESLQPVAVDNFFFLLRAKSTYRLMKYREESVNFVFFALLV
jgi:hypothetical protein